MKSLVILLVCLFGVQAERKRYDGYQLLKIIPKDSAQADYVYEQSGDPELDFWYEGRDRFDILVPPHKVADFQAELDFHSIAYSVVNPNVQQDIDVETTRLAARANLAINYDDFNTYDAIMAELDLLASECPTGSLCSTFTVGGGSAQGRPIKGLRIYRNGANRRAIYIDATIHAREWLATATHLKILNHLIRNPTDTYVAYLLATYDFWLVPIANPDGYVYTWTNDRLWRKNRTPNTGSTCVGTDLNRNYNQMWGNAGAATTPCSETYRGSSAGSEPETVAVQNFLQARQGTLLFSIHFHTYGQLWLMPWGSTLANGQCNYATDNAEMLVVANAAANAVQSTYNTQWARGNSCATIYPASGITMDYAKGVTGVKYTFTPELRGNNFVIAATQIQPSFLEVWNGVRATVDAVERANAG